MARGLGIRLRFTMMYGIASVLTSLLLCGGIYFFIQRALMEQVENHLRKDLATIQQYLQYDPAALSKVADHGPIHLFKVQEGSRLVIASHGWKAESLESVSNAAGAGDHPASLQVETGKPYLVLTGSATVQDHRFRIFVAHQEEGVRQNKRTLALIMLLSFPVAVAVSLVIGYFLAGRVLAPISAITRKAEEISAESLSERLPIGESDDEFSRLAMVFNQAFARIEDSFQRLKRFTADASHEMRTPLAAIRSIGETALHSQDADCREAVGSILEENDRLRQMIDSLLVLSRADSGEVELVREQVDLSALAREALDFLSVLAEEKHQTITLAADLPVLVTVDRATIRQALINLLDNAIKYSPADSAITMTVSRSGNKEAYLSIKDSGIGIPDKDLQRIFDRFYRVDKSRSRETGGAGLGLAITKWAVECNKGRIEAYSELGKGSEFRVVFEEQP